MTRERVRVHGEHDKIRQDSVAPLLRRLPETALGDTSRDARFTNAADINTHEPLPIAFLAARPLVIEEVLATIGVSLALLGDIDYGKVSRAINHQTGEVDRSQLRTGTGEGFVAVVNMMLDPTSHWKFSKDQLAIAYYDGFTKQYAADPEKMLVMMDEHIQSLNEKNTEKYNKGWDVSTTKIDNAYITRGILDKCIHPGDGQPALPLRDCQLLLGMKSADIDAANFAAKNIQYSK
ncbi:MAG: hypothetical protein M3Q44_01155 [bacterium]|nr:hypothetical protein [bacterium]